MTRVPSTPGSTDAPSAASVRERWRKAERTIGDPPALRRAADALPPRLAWLLRAIDALERGERTTIRSVATAAREAGQLDVAGILDLLAVDPQLIVPRQVRQTAKRDGVANLTRVPVLDLLRMLACARSGDRSYRSRAMVQATRSRPVLRWVVKLLHERDTLPPSPLLGSEHAREGARLDSISRRIVPLWLAADARRRGFDDVRAYIAESTHNPPPMFPRDRWSDLDRRSAESELEAWLSGESGVVWNDRLASAVKAWHRRPEPQRRRLLGRLLARIDQQLRGGRPLQAKPAVRAARVLAESLTDDRWVLLAIQLVILDVRLEWFLPDCPRSIELVVELWRRVKARPIAERRIVARELVTIPDKDLDRRLKEEAAVSLAIAAPSIRERAIWMQICGSFIDGKTLAKVLPALAGGKESEIELEREHLRGLHALSRGKGGQVFDSVAALLARGGARAVELGLHLLRETLDEEARERRSAAGSMARTFAACARIPPRRDAAASLLPRLAQVLDAGAYAKALAQLGPALTAGLTDPTSPAWDDNLLAQSDVAYDLLGWELVGQPDRAARIFRDLGRALRRGAVAGDRRPVDPDQLALRIGMRLVACGALIVGSHAPRQWIEALNAFLLREGPEHLSQELRRLDVAELVTSDDAVGLAAWYLQYRRQLRAATAWEQLFGSAATLTRREALGGGMRLLAGTLRLLPCQPAARAAKEFLFWILSQALAGERLEDRAEVLLMFPDGLLDDDDDDDDDDLDDDDDDMDGLDDFLELEELLELDADTPDDLNDPENLRAELDRTR